jgi:hypothetical protein
VEISPTMSRTSIAKADLRQSAAATVLRVIGHTVETVAVAAEGPVVVVVVAVIADAAGEADDRVVAAGGIGAGVVGRAGEGTNFFATDLRGLARM